MQWNAAVTIVYQHENHFLILAIKSCVFSVSCLVSELVSVPDSQMNQSFGLSNWFSKRHDFVHNSVWFVWTIHSQTKSIVTHSRMQILECFLRQKTKRAPDEIDIYLQSIVGNKTCRSLLLFIIDEEAFYCMNNFPFISPKIFSKYRLFWWGACAQVLMKV